MSLNVELGDEQLLVVMAAADASDESGVSLRLLLASAWALSGLVPDYRWPPAEAGMDEQCWPWVGAGAWRQRVSDSPEYTGRGLGGGYPGAAVVADVARHYLNPLHAALVAAYQLRSAIRPRERDGDWRALCRWFWPSGDGVPVSGRLGQLFRVGLEVADDILLRYGEAIASRERQLPGLAEARR